ncbi:hypothetical protein MJG53_019934 [Ovis ammon polii x Ovis aries]|uniref:Uncharacterized protein n=1 Tax=Ovis ammon polii x Ovis aries TaxID=2918886 RepID=A0ACB9U175_9CETA|nr:hypothetical protein MJG53_019934 [Ovis ammon polii x Ovis aries]
METVKLNDHEPTFTQQMAKWIEVTESPRLGVQFQARNMTMRVRRPLKGTLRKKIRSYATPSKKVKKTREPNCFLRSCARTKYDHEGQKTSERNLEKENLVIRHSVEEGTKCDHEGQKTSKRNLEKENPIECHSVEEGEENKRTKLFSPILCT